MDATVGLIGDSHAQYGVDSKAFPELANFARRATPPLLWGVEIDKILDLNPNIKTFVVELCPGQLAQNLSRTPHERAHLSRCYIPENFMLELVYAHKWGGDVTESFSRDYMRGILLPFFKRIIMFSPGSELNGGYRPIYHKIEETHWWKTGKRVDFVAGEPPSDKETEVLHEVESILDVIHDRGVRLVLVTMPQWKWFRDRSVTPSQMKFYNETMQILQKRYNCEWFDFRDELQDLKYWGDNSHLNNEGAKRFAAMLSEKILKRKTSEEE